MFELPQWLFRMDNFLMYMGLYPDAVHRLQESLVKAHLESLEKWIDSVGPYVDVVLFGDDLGGQNCPLISPRMYREFIKPYHKKLWKRTKELADVKVMLHCCGSIYALIPDLIDAGLDAVNPVQISCEGMDVSRLKQEFAGQMSFWGGGCDTRTMLGQGLEGQIKDHVYQQAKILYLQGGGVFQQVHNIMANVPPQNVVTMLDTAITVDESRFKTPRIIKEIKTMPKNTVRV